MALSVFFIPNTLLRCDAVLFYIIGLTVSGIYEDFIITLLKIKLEVYCKVFGTA